MKAIPEAPPTNPRPEFEGLSDLSRVTLDAKHRRLYDIGAGFCGGGAVWRRRKLSELSEFLALSQISGRIETKFVDLSNALRLLFLLKVAVPTRPDPDGDLVIHEVAELALTYSEAAIRTPQPGYSFVDILFPANVWIANVEPPEPKFGRRGPGRALCLGTQLPAGIPVKEIVLMSYGALTLQNVQLDARDAAGVLNGESADWWLRNRHRIPLTRESFLGSAHPRIDESDQPENEEKGNS